MTEDKVSRYRAKLKAAGVAQVNLMAPVSRHGQLRDIAKAMRDDPEVSVTYSCKVSSDPAAPRVSSHHEAPSDADAPEVSSDPTAQEIIDAYLSSSKARDPQGKLDQAASALVKAHLRPLVEGAVQQRIADQDKRLRDWASSLHERKKEIERLEARVNERAKTVNGYMTRDEYKLILACLHTDREATPERKAKAFAIMQRMEKHVDPLTPIKTLREQGRCYVLPALFP